MANLKALKNRIKSVKSTQKITKAMQMVAASKLRRAQMAAEAARPFAVGMENMLKNLATGFIGNNSAPQLLVGNGKDINHLLIVATSDRGLAGAFNSGIVKAARVKLINLLAQGKRINIFSVGRKGDEYLKSVYGENIIHRITGIKQPTFKEAEEIARDITNRFNAGEFDVCGIFYSKFKSVISQEPTYQQLIPLEVKDLKEGQGSDLVYDYEPNEEEILKDLLPQNIAIQIYRALLENAASEQAAKMTAMDNATRNAGEMIKDLSLVYNRTRQAAITTELIEIIAGAEAV